MSAGHILSAAVVALGVFGSFLPAHAEPYPTRPIKAIVRPPAGGPGEVVARVVGNYLAAALGQAVVVDNRPGAGNTIGSKEAAQAEPDGYTLLYSSVSGLVLAPMLQKNAGYDPLTSYDPIALVAQSSNILVVHPSVPVGSVQELVAYAKANPGKVNFSSGGIGVLPHLIGEWFKSAAAIDIVHVPYRGGGPSINDLVAGQVQMTFEGTSVLLLQAHRGAAGPADHGREQLRRLRLDELDRAAGAGAHAARRDRQAQCPDQRGSEIGGTQIRARQAQQSAIGRHAAGLHRYDQWRHRQVGADREGPRSDGRLIGCNPRARQGRSSRHRPRALRRSPRQRQPEPAADQRDAGQAAEQLRPR